jgi:tRNA(His) 5'-end guanylyltransferase
MEAIIFCGIQATGNFNNLPNWQKRGIGIYWKNIVKDGFNPKKNEKVSVERRELYVDTDLPMRIDYDNFMLEIINKNETH